MYLHCRTCLFWVRQFYFSEIVKLTNLQVQDQIAASPIEIARAYMDSRVSEAGPSSKDMIHVVENTVLHGVDGAIKPYDPSPSKKSSTCWPGAVVRDAYITPQSQRRYGLQNFPRTPYSRTLLTKSKSKVLFLFSCTLILQVESILVMFLFLFFFFTSSFTCKEKITTFHQLPSFNQGLLCIYRYLSV